MILCYNLYIERGGRSLRTMEIKEILENLKEDKLS